jgi:hypothetical protein
MAIWYIFLRFWYIVSRKIWQPCVEGSIFKKLQQQFSVFSYFSGLGAKVLVRREARSLPLVLLCFMWLLLQMADLFFASVTG